MWGAASSSDRRKFDGFIAGKDFAWLTKKLKLAEKEKNPTVLIKDYQTYARCLHGMAVSYEKMESLHEALLKKYPPPSTGQELSSPPVMAIAIDDVVENLIRSAVDATPEAVADDNVDQAEKVIPEGNPLGYQIGDVNDDQVGVSEVVDLEKPRSTRKKTKGSKAVSSELSSWDLILETVFGSSEAFLQCEPNHRVEWMNGAVEMMRRCIKNLFLLESTVKHRIIRCKFDQFLDLNNKVFNAMTSHHNG